jgi:hypothetical protein
MSQVMRPIADQAVRTPAEIEGATGCKCTENSAAGRGVLREWREKGWIKEGKLIGDKLEDGADWFREMAKGRGYPRPMHFYRPTSIERMLAVRTPALVIAEQARAFDAPIIPLVLDLRRQGVTFDAIARELERQGIENRRGKQWHSSKVRQILVRNGLPTDQTGLRTPAEIESSTGCKCTENSGVSRSAICHWREKGWLKEGKLIGGELEDGADFFARRPKAAAATRKGIWNSTDQPRLSAARSVGSAIEAKTTG